jgi:hypothetical protein
LDGAESNAILAVSGIGEEERVVDITNLGSRFTITGT